jgi:DNA primase
VIPKQTIQDILDTARIEEVVGDFVHLKRRGVSMIGLCPFHNEKTPSFTVSPSKGIFKCFGCGEAGSSVDFLMKHEHLSFPQAVKWLAQKYHIEIEEEEQTPEQIQSENEREGLFALTQFASQFFVNQLHNTEMGKAIGLSYFNERGFAAHTIDKFQLGYSPESWDALVAASLAAGYTKEYLVKTGLAVAKETGEIYDRFRQRVIFPIHNASGRVIGFGGRILVTDKTKPKYVNSPESAIYDKSNVLYGLFTAKNAVIKNDNCFLVEGYTDVISLFQTGIENVVSSSGTSLTVGQIKLIKRFTQNVTILYDGDPAGIKASFRGINMLVEEGLNVRVVLFPDGEDPDSYARKHNAEALKEFLSNHTQDFIHFKADLLSKEAANDPVRKAEVVKEIVNTISLVPEQLNRLYFIRETAELLNIAEDILVNEVSKILRNKFFKDQKKDDFVPDPVLPKAPPQHLNIDEGDYLQEKELIRLMLNYGHIEFKIKDAGIRLDNNDSENESVKVWRFIIEELLIDEISIDDANLRAIFNEYQQAYATDQFHSEQFFSNHSEEIIRRTVGDLLSNPYTLSPNWEEKHRISTSLETDPDVIARACMGGVYALKIKKITSRKKELVRQMMNPAFTEEEKMVLLTQYARLDRIQNQLNNDLGRIVVG